MAKRLLAFHAARTKDQYDAILAVGIRKGSYFAFNAYGAVTYGGDYLFCVDFDPNGTWKGEPDGWQFRSRDWVDVLQIIWHGHIHRRIYPTPIVNPLVLR